MIKASKTSAFSYFTDSDGKIVSYRWSQYDGPLVPLNNADQPTVSIENLRAGKYYFKLTVTDDKGASHSDNVLVRVEDPATF